MDISIAIGRNVGDQPMDDERFFCYKVDLLHILSDHGYNVTNREDGTSQYVYDGTWHVEAFHRVWATNPEPGARDIRDHLGKLAARYGQWGIAYTVAKFTELVKAS